MLILEVSLKNKYLVLSIIIKHEKQGGLDEKTIITVYKANLDSNLAGFVIDADNNIRAESAIIAELAERDEIIDHVKPIVGISRKYNRLI